MLTEMDYLGLFIVLDENGWLRMDSSEGGKVIYKGEGQSTLLKQEHGPHLTF